MEKELQAKEPDNRGKTVRHYAFFQNTQCEFFPCHPTDDPSRFNCLFCYCPFYLLGENCGGNFSLTETGIKDCSACLYPHKAENYDRITGRWNEIAAAMPKKE